MANHYKNKQNIKKSAVFFHLPYSKIDRYLDSFIEHKMNPEIYFDAESLDCAKKKDIKNLSSILKKNDMKAIVHAPFRDLNLGSGDAIVREVAITRIFQALDFAGILGAKTIVVHSGFDQIYNDKIKDKWMARTQEVLAKILKKAEKLSIDVLVENAIENNVNVIVEIIKGQNKKNIGMCLDAAHVNVFCDCDILDFIRENKDIIGEMHLSDNHGDVDSHLPLGQGNIDFKQILDALKENDVNANITVESHTPEDSIISLEYLENL